jgi:RND family efflux transporter MFP subunit
MNLSTQAARPLGGGGPANRFGSAFYRAGIAQRLRLWAVAALLAGLSGCSDPPPPPVETVRSIRTITVSEPASGRVRRFSGTVEAADTAGLGFEVPGTVQEVKVEVGERTVKGAVLARLDQRTFKLNVEAAQADVGRARVELQEAQNDVDRFRRISPGAVSQRERDQAEARYDSARKNLSLTMTRLNLAKQDLDRTLLRAPFDGIVARRFVDPFRQVALGEKIVELQMEGAMEVSLSVPESEIGYIYLGLPGRIRFPAIPGLDQRGIVTEISQVVGRANAFPVKLTIQSDDPRIRSGITAEVTLQLGNEIGQTAFLIPIEALSPGGTESESAVFVFDAASSTVKKTAIQIGTVRTSNVTVSEGLKAGDIIAVAGVSFLRDGQKVRLQGR